MCCRAFASDHKFNVISMNDFGRAVRSVFPNVRDKRIGKRGGTKYSLSNYCLNYLLVHVFVFRVC